MSEEEKLAPQRLGDTNGWTLRVFKFVVHVIGLLILPMLGLQVWYVTSIYDLKSQVYGFVSAGPRYTQKDATADDLKLKEQILDEVDNKYPPQWLRDTVESLNRRVESLERKGSPQ